MTFLFGIPGVQTNTEQAHLSADDMFVLIGICLQRNTADDPFPEDYMRIIGDEAVKDMEHFRNPETNLLFLPAVVHCLAQNALPHLMLYRYKNSDKVKFQAGAFTLSESLSNIIESVHDIEPLQIRSDEINPDLIADLDPIVVGDRWTNANTFLKGLEKYVTEKQGLTQTNTTTPAAETKSGFLDNLRSIFGGIFKKKDRGLRHDM